MSGSRYRLHLLRALCGLLGWMALVPGHAATPQAMLTLSRDEQWFHVAYPDGRDLDGDGVVEQTYADTFEYTGYFHPNRCYRYNDTDKAFAVVGISNGLNQHFCDGALDDAWSGNFLNWATMTRLDVLRKVLYGGYRSTDTATTTILERAHLPSDAHSFAKYYNGSEIDLLVPFPNVKVDGDNGGDNDGVDDANEGITVCNVSYKATGSSQGTTGASPSVTPDPAPMLRVVMENFQLWDSNDRRQCTWQNESGSNGNSNSSADSGIFAAGSDPADTKQLKTPGGVRDHIVRIKACDPTFFDPESDPEHCTLYGANRKPEGQLQRYGLSDQIRFGLLTGSYLKNLSGGVLRKAVGPFTDEVSANDGTFVVKTGAEPGIIRTLNALRVFGYAYNGGTYGFDATDKTASGEDCSFQITNVTEGKCRSWGNPQSEIYLEALRYFALAGAARAPTPAFDTDDSTAIAGLVKDAWTADPLSPDNLCASINTVVINAGVSSYDDDQTNGMSAVFGDVKALTDVVGDGEGITGKPFFVGRISGSGDEYCTLKNVTSLGDTYGLCPASPTLRGSFHMAGLAHYARTHDLRPDLAGVQTLKTFAVQLPLTLLTIDVPIGPAASATQRVEVTPAYRLRKGGNNSSEGSNNPSNDGGGTLIRSRAVTRHTEVVGATSTVPATGTGHFYAKFYLAWDDSEQGADLDQDDWGTLEYRVNSNVIPATITVTTKAVAQSIWLGRLFGFSINGTTQDGFHAYSGTQGGNYFASTVNDPTGVRGCSNCRALSESGGQRGAQSHTFAVSNTPSKNMLETPLFYAAKWGGFEHGIGDPPDAYFAPRSLAALDGNLDTVFTRIAADAALPATGCLPDGDADGVPDSQDNCPALENADQRDTNQDGFGNRCDADLNGDGKVNTIDFGIFKVAFGKTTNPDADFNADGRVNTLDFGIFKQLFGVSLF